MKTIAILLGGEMNRQIKYGILGAGMVVVALWIAVLHFADVGELDTLLPLLIYIDATAMAILLIGVTIFFERQEGTLKGLLVAPVSKGQYVLAKTLGNIVSNWITLVILFAYAWGFRDVSLNVLTLALAVFLVVFLHSMVGLLLTYSARSFTDMLMAMMRYLFIFMLPVVFVELGLIQNAVVDWLLYLLPTKASMVVMMAATGSVSTGDLIYGWIYLVVVSYGLLRWTLRRFDEFAVRESGV